MRQRLSSREGTDDMGNTAENREWVLSWKNWWENQLIEKGTVVVDADGNPTEVAKKIIEIVN